MKVLKYLDIVNYLDENNINYSILNKVNIQDEYFVASLFSPIIKGFYFFSGKEFNFTIEKSLILTSSLIESDSNVSIIVKNIDVQLLYYRLLDHFYARKSNGIIDNFAKVDFEAKIGENVQIDAFTVIDNCEIGNNVIIGSNCRVYGGVIIEDNTIIESGSIIGTRGLAWTWNEDQSEKVFQPQLGGVVVQTGCILGANTIIVRGSLNENTEIGEYSHLAPGCRLGHGTRIGKYSHLANAVITGGNTRIGDYCFVGSGVVFRPKAKIHDSSIVGAGSVVIKNTTKVSMTLMGVPAKEFETKEHLSGMPKPKK